MEDMLPLGEEPNKEKLLVKELFKTGKLDFEDVYFIKELQFNLFSVSQMCDKKNSVLFTNTGCFHLSPDFKLADESQGLGHVIFKMSNKLVKENLVRGLPSKRFENGQLVLLVLRESNTKASCAGPKWLFDIDVLTKSMSYVPVLVGTNSNDFTGTEESIGASHSSKETGSSQDYILMPLWKDGSLFDSSSKNASNDEPQPSSDAGKKDDEGVITTARSNGSQTEPNMFSLGDNATLKATHADFFGDETKVDMSNITTTYPVPSTPNTRIHKDHSLDHVIEDVQSGVQTRKMTRTTNEQGFISTVYEEKTHENLQNCLFACLLSQVKPKKGYTQEEGIHYDEVFAPVARIEAIRLFLAYASFKDFVVYQMDVKSEFLYGNIEEEVYVCQPLGFEDPEFPDRVYKVEKALYGLHQALRAWKTYTMETSKPLLKDAKAEDVDVHLYRSMIRSLMYLIAFRPDIIFVVCASARFQVTPKVSHLHAVKRIFRYLKGQPKLGLWYPKDSPFDLEAYTDSDYAGASLDRKSTTGGCQFLGSRLISWQCKKQTIVANSTTEVEYVAASSCCGQTKHIEIRHHFIRDSNEKKLIQMIKIHTDQNVADLLTKAFDVGRFQYLIATANDAIQVNDVSLPYYCHIGLLLLNPTIYVSLIQQFWQTATASTLDNGEMEITATIDGKVKIVTEASIRRHLKLEDSDGISNLPTTEIFKQLALMGVDISLFPTMLVQGPVVQGEGSTHLVESHHTPTSAPPTLQPPISSTSRRLTRQEYVVPQPRSPTQTNVPNEAASTGVDVRLGGAATTVTSLNAGQGSGNIDNTLTMPHDSPLPRVHTLGSDEGRMQHNELMDLVTKLSNRVVALETDLTQTKKVYGAAFTKLIKKVKRLEKKDKLNKSRRKLRLVLSDEEGSDSDILAQEDPSKQGRKIAQIDEDEGITLVQMGVSTASTDFTTTNVPVTTAGAEISTASPEVTTASDSVDDIATESLVYIRRSAAKTKDKGKGIMEESGSDMTKTKRQQEQERLGLETAVRVQEEFDEEERQRIARVHEAARSFSKVEWEDIRARFEAFEELVQRLQIEEKEKYSEDNQAKMLQLKRLSFDEIKDLFETTMRRANTFVPMETKIRKGVLELVADSSQALVTESTKAGGTKRVAEEELGQQSSKKQKDDLVKLWSLVQERFNSTEPTEDKEIEIWVELKRLFELDADDELWKSHKHIHDITWRLYDTSGVHHVCTKDGMDIYMLVKREYTLSRGVLTQMLVAKLLVE
ncbi:putative ribonuclease H-like domain-containing protein [Tanacetum coccineum]